MRYLNTVYVRSHEARITRSKGSLLVRHGEERTRIPLESVDGVVVVGGATMTLDAVAACVERGIRVSVLRRSGALRWSATPPISGNVTLRRLQHRASDDPGHRLMLARWFIAAKMQNSVKVIRRWARDAPDGDTRRRLESRAQLIAERIGRLENSPTLDHVRGIEGDGARAHFSCLGIVLEGTRFPFAGRQRRPPRDPVNALLGFCYGLLATELVGALETVGLDPQIGFLHSDRAGRPALALDLAEELRPVIDRFGVGLFRRRQLGDDDFTKTPGGGTYLSDAGREKLFAGWEEHKTESIYHSVVERDVERWTVPGIQATLLARHLRGDLSVYPPYLLQV